MSTIHLIRHGTTEGNQRKLFYGSTDLPLAEEGVKLIQSLAAQGIYPRVEDGEYYTSGLLRAEQTFSIIYGTTKHTVISKLEEYHFGDFEMKNHEELEPLDAYQAWMMDKEGKIACPNGESPVMFRKRVWAGFQRLLKPHLKEEKDNRQTILVCHGGVISNIMIRSFPDVKRNYYQWLPNPGRGYSIQIRDKKIQEFQDI